MLGANRTKRDAQMNAPPVTVEGGEGEAVIRLAGRLVVAALSDFETGLKGAPRARAIELDLSGVEALDTAGAWLVVSLSDRLRAEGAEVRLSGVAPAQAALIETVREAMAGEHIPPEKERGFTAFLERLGRATVEGRDVFVEGLGFFGLVLARLGQTMLQPRRLRVTSLVHHMQEVGFNAVPIVSLMAFLIGVVLAFQGAAQLTQFGAEVFVVELIAISVLRELGILLTAIIVAGRSGSAFTAAIGSMKVREEIDAMRTLGLDPIEVLVIPRVVALLIMLPVLGFVADVAGLLGGALMAWIELGVSPGMFVTRLNDTISVWHPAIGLIKAPFFALIVGVVGCFMGMQVGGSAESVGRLTTKSVVVSIFAVIMADAVFSIFFAELGI